MDGANLARPDKKDNPRETTHCRARRSPKAPAAPYLKGTRGTGAGTRGDWGWHEGGGSEGPMESGPENIAFHHAASKVTKTYDFRTLFPCA